MHAVYTKRTYFEDFSSKLIMTKLNDDNINKSTTTQEQQTPSQEDQSWRWTPEQEAKYRLSPEQRREMDKGHQKMVDAMIKGLAKDNGEIFGTPIPEHLK